MLDKKIENQTNIEMEKVIAVHKNSGFIFQDCTFQIGSLDANKIEENIIQSNDNINRQIDKYKDDLEEFKTKTALDGLEKLKEDNWDKIDNKTKYRIVGNIACAKMNLEKYSRAGQLFIEALSYDPENEKAISNAVVGYFILEEHENAFKTLNKGLGKYPNSTLLLSRKISLYIDDLSYNDPKSLISNKAAFENPNICLAIASFYQKRNNFDLKLKWAEKAYIKDEGNDINIKAFYATSLLETIIKGKDISVIRLLTDENKKKLKKIIKIYEEAWELLKTSENFDKFLYIPLNLLSSYMISGNKEKEEKLLNKLSLNTNSPEVLRKKASFLLGKGLKEEALKIAKKIPDNSFEEQYIMLGEILKINEEYDEALKYIDKGIKKKKIHNDLKNQANILKAEIIHIKDGEEKSFEFLEKNKKISTSLKSMIKYNITNDIKYLIDAKNKLSKKDSNIIQLEIAENLFREKEEEKSSELYKILLKGITDTKNAHFNNYLICLVNLDTKRKELENILNSIEETNKTDFIYVIEGAYQEKIGNLIKAKELFEEALIINPQNTQAFMRKCHTLHRLENRAELRQFLKSVPNLKRATILERGNIATLLKHYNFKKEALCIIYDNLCDNFDSGEAWNLYLEVMITLGLPLKSPDKIEEDTFFVLEDKNSKSILPYIVDDKFPQSMIARNLKKEDSFYKILEEKKINDEIRINNNTFIVKSVLNKYIGIFQTLLKNMSVFFPENNKFSVFSSKDPMDIIDFAKQNIGSKEGGIKEIFKAYEKVFPISSTGKFLNLNSIEMVNELENSQTSFIKTSAGSPEEMEFAKNLLKNNEKGFLIDETALYTIFKMGVEEEFFNIIENIAITQEVIDIINQTIEKNKADIKNDGGTLFFNKETQDMNFIDNSMKREPLRKGNQFLQNILDWINENNFEIIPATQKEELNKEQKSLISFLELNNKNFIFSAWASNRLIISNDFNLGLISKKAFDIDCIWLQSILLYGLNKEKIKYKKYIDCVIYLIKFNYKFTTFNASILSFLIENNRIEDFEVLAKQLGYCSPKSALNVSIEFLKNEDKRNYNEKNKISNIVFNSLTKNYTHNLSKKIIEFFDKTKNLYSADFEENFNNWKKGHFIT